MQASSGIWGRFFIRPITMISELPVIDLPGSKVQKIAIQGFRGSFHELAARKFFGEEIELHFCTGFPELFQSLDKQQAEIGIMAIENSVAGSLLPNYALLRNSHYVIIGEVYLRIKHNLMAIEGQSIQDIREVHSHPMALLQCQTFFEKHPGIKLVEAEDTALSAQRISEGRLYGVAAIAGALAAQYYDLEILAEGIESNQRNFTRFLIIHSEKNTPLQFPQPNKATLCFNLAGLSQKIGSLAGILSILGHYGMNLTKIQSLPILGMVWEYFFHIDLEFESYDRYKLALDAIRPLVSELKILGEYTKGNTSDNN